MGTGARLEVVPPRQSSVALGSLSGTGTVVLNANLVVGGLGNSETFDGVISGGGGGTNGGHGNVTLSGANTYSGGTIVTGGVLQGDTTSLQGNIVNASVVSFNQSIRGTYSSVMSGAGQLIVQGGGTVVLTGNNTFTGSTNVYRGSNLVVNGTLGGTIQVAGTLGGSGVLGNVELEPGGRMSPGNSIGTLTIGGNLRKTHGHYHLEVNGASQGDRINVGGTAVVGGSGTVLLNPEPGIYANRTTYTILSAAGGVSGAYAGVVSDLAFLTPTLSYDANNVYLTLALQGAAFSGFSGNTPNQRATGYALDQSYASASGDYATVIGALAGLSTAQASAALSAISSQPWANFGTTNLASNALFMNTLGQQMALARGGQASS